MALARLLFAGIVNYLKRIIENALVFAVVLNINRNSSAQSGLNKTTQNKKAYHFYDRLFKNKLYGMIRNSTIGCL